MIKKNISKVLVLAPHTDDGEFGSRASWAAAAPDPSALITANPPTTIGPASRQQLL